MAKQVKTLNLIMVGDGTQWNDLAAAYVVEDSADAALIKEGTVTVTWTGSTTLDALRTAIETAVNTKEGIA
jgi:hypothetical protein